MATEKDLPPNSIASRIASAWSTEFALNLDREAISFLAGIHAFLDLNPEPFLSETHLRDIFAFVSELSHGDPSTLAARATRAIAGLREQQLLVRGDLGGLAQEGEYGLSQLGKALAQWVGQEETLTRASLETMMTRIRADLAEVKAMSEQGGDAAHWEKRVVAPLKFTVSGLMQMIDRRSRGLDREQEQVRVRIGELLEAGWFDAIDTCENLLEEVSSTLGELHRTLMGEAEGVSNQLNAIADIADEAGELSALEAVQHVRLQLERVTLWGDARHQAWSDYYQNVHEFIRSVVRIDRDRALRGRLKQAIQTYGTPTWHLLCCAQDQYRHLREEAAAMAETRVARPAAKHVHDLELGEPVPTLLETLLPQLQKRLKEDGRIDLVSVLKNEAADWDEARQYSLISALVPWLAGNGRPTAWHELAWEQIGPRLSVQNLSVYRKDAS
ncbi:condesin subunit F [Sulfurifustis variabilis]|uniref:Condesin subunit F n=1 Tax=Sulfurifustis variabilis TaxID=1675686 RepID=A0A1B4V7S6_9GAMM|nr:hypothetical protein [Sulfurifustis variabilis]BAU49579.1 condesin subunit F [Sulfurifustis variabilis]